MSTMEFEYLEIRPCIERGGYITSYASEDEYETALAGYESDAQKLEQPFKTFWTLYGRHFDKEGQVTLATAIGDFTTKNDAHEIMNAIIAPMAHARNLINEHGAAMIGEGNAVPIPAYERATSNLDDFINQCSNEERI